MKPLVYDLTYEALQQWMKDHGEPVFRADQLMDWLYVKRASSFDEMTNLSKQLRQKLSDELSMEALNEITRFQSKDGTVKYLYELRDKHAIETVVMQHEYGNSICVTTQVGCQIGCTFCASTLGGLKRDLTAGEIVMQVVQSQRDMDKEGKRIDSIVIMGIGEPFENYDAMLAFLHMMIHPKGLNIGQRHITVSTSGIVPNIYRFADEGLQIKLAISLHAPNQLLRSKLMPVNKKYPLSDLMAACRYYIETTGRRITFEYALIGGRNDQPEHAEELADLLKGIMCHVNLIPVNHVPERKYVRTSKKDIFQFYRILKEKGINTTIRREQGHDIEAACGQLRAKHLETSSR